MRRTFFAAAAVLAAASVHAQSKAGIAPGFVEMKASGVPGKATATRQGRLTATVKQIDAASRTVTLQNKAGATQAIRLGPGVERFSEIAVGDTVEVAVEQDLVLEYQSAGTPDVLPTAVAGGDRAASDQAPGGVVAAGVRATVVVTAIDSPNRMVVFQGPGGTLYQVKAGPDVKLEKLKVGDRLLATYVEALAVSLQKSGKK